MSGLGPHRATEYPEEFSDWRKVEPKALIDAELIKSPSAKSVVNALKNSQGL